MPTKKKKKTKRFDIRTFTVQDEKEAAECMWKGFKYFLFKKPIKTAILVLFMAAGTWYLVGDSILATTVSIREAKPIGVMYQDSGLNSGTYDAKVYGAISGCEGKADSEAIALAIKAESWSIWSVMPQAYADETQDMRKQQGAPGIWFNNELYGYENQRFVAKVILNKPIILVYDTRTKLVHEVEFHGSMEKFK